MLTVVTDGSDHLDELNQNLSSRVKSLVILCLILPRSIYRVTIRPGFPGFVSVLWSVSLCPDDLCKIAKIFRFFTCEEGKKIVNSDLGNVSTLSSYKHCPGLSIQSNFSCLTV